MEIFYVLVVIGLVAIFWKAIIALFAAMGGLMAILVPIAIVCAIIYIIMNLF
tara:strand:- start:1469 stop:1624 length:156 start_codon:yes stop_codon:yes gene_type:complete